MNATQYLAGVVAVVVAVLAKSAFSADDKFASCPELTASVSATGAGTIEHTGALPRSAMTFHIDGQDRISDIRVQDHYAGNPGFSLREHGHTVTEVARNQRGRVRHVLVLSPDRTSMYLVDCVRHTVSLSVMTLDGGTLFATGRCHRWLTC